MIDEKKTYEKFGYYSSDLTPKSNKKIVCICNECGKERILKKDDYRDLCKSCCRSGEKHPLFGKIGKDSPNFGNHHSIETIKNLSDINRGENNPMFGKYGANHPMYGKHHSIEVKGKMSIARKGKYCGENGSNYIDGKSQERTDARRRGFPKLEHFLGNKYNDKYKIVGHHFNEKIIIYIPERLHQKHSHNLRTGKGMKEINKLAIKFLLKGNVS